MPAVQLSRSARADLLRIGAYTLERWGPAQTVRYLSTLEDCAKMLAANRFVGRACMWTRPGLRRFEKGRHVFFYRPIEDGIFISRILHSSVLPENAVLKIRLLGCSRIDAVTFPRTSHARSTVTRRQTQTATRRWPAPRPQAVPTLSHPAAQTR